MFGHRGIKGSSSARGLRLIAVVAVLAASTVLASPVGAIPEQKTYTAVVSPDSVGSGQTIDFTLTVVNTSGSQQIGSANVTAPSTFSLISTHQPSPAGTATIVGSTGGTLQLRNLALPPGGTVTVTFRTEVPCATGDYPWSIIAKQSNNFSGPPGNNFTLDVAGSNLTTLVNGQCSVDWLTQPSDTRSGDAITHTAYDAFVSHGHPEGPFIRVGVLSAPYTSGPPTPVSFSTDVITLVGVDASSGTANLGGTDEVNAVNGVATFDPGPTIDVAGLNYKLRALLASNYTAPVSSLSSEFDISDSVCAAPCTTDFTGEGTRARATSDSATGFVAVSVGIRNDVTCPDYTPPPNQQVVAILLLGVSETSTLTVETTLDASVVDRPWSQLRVCWATSQSFTGADGTPADPVTIAGDPYFRDVLVGCDRRTPMPPCQLPTTMNNRTGAVTLHVLAPGNDPLKH
jgi:hypothetical protein